MRLGTVLLFPLLLACEAEEAPAPPPASISEYKQRIDGLSEQQ